MKNPAGAAMSPGRGFMACFFSPELEFRVRLFNILAMAGVVISLAAALICVLNREGLPAVLACGATTFIAAGLLIYASRTGRYQRCYVITIVVIFLIFFPLIFFVGGAYFGAMPFYFIFAVVFTVFMVEGKRALLITGLELSCYILLCVCAYRHPHMVTRLSTGLAEFIDIVLGFTVVGIVLGTTMFFHFRLYGRQQRELERARERALAASEAKSRFLANMSHEIRTPIGVMLGMNEMILREADSPRIKACGRGAENAGQQLLTLIDNILDLSAIEKGKLAITREPFETAELILALSVVGESFAGRQNLRFITRAQESLPRRLTGDMLHIRQIVSNFLSNAAKYTREGEIRLCFAGAPARSPDEITLEIAVSDTGAGIPEKELPGLFDAFARGESRGQHVEGSGLGLAIAKEYAGAMGGRVTADSRLGRGSVFRLELTLKIHDPRPMGRWDQPEPSPESPAPRAGLTAPGRAILIVDDSRENLTLLRFLLSKTLADIDTAASGAQCLALVKERRYDVIIMDYMMPDMDGRQTLGHLRALPGFDIPVIALTANVTAGVRQGLLAAGFCRCLSKPVSGRVLEGALLELLPGARATPTGPPGPPLPVEVRGELAAVLAPAGVDLNRGLGYVEGDLVQYGRRAEIFVENYDRTAKAIRALAAAGDWQGLGFQLHSLKSGARGLGAGELSGTAAKLERLCAAERGALAASFLPGLLLELSEVRRGLVRFGKRLEGLLPEPESQEPPPSPAQLLQMLRFNRYPSARRALTSLIQAEGGSGRAEDLKEIQRKTDELKFREAEALLSALMERGAVRDGE